MPPRTTALPDAVTSALRPVQLPRQPHVRLVITRILRPLPYRHGQAGGGSRLPTVPLRFTAARLAAHPPPKRLRSPACGIVLAVRCHSLTHHASGPQRMPQRRCKKAHRERLTCRRAAVARAATSGRYGVKCCPRHSRRFRTPIVVCAAWSFLRDHLTPRPAVAKSTYRFCVRKIRYSPALQKTSANHRAGESPQSSGVGRSRLGKHRSSRHPLAGRPSNLNPPSSQACGFRCRR